MAAASWPEPLAPDPGTTATLHQRIAEYLSGPDRWKVKRVVAQFTLLPVYADIGGILFVSPDGTVFSCSNNDIDPDPTPEPEAMWRIIGVVAAAERYPELTSLLPQRPNSAATCAECSGSGHLALPGIASKAFCSTCSGLGWVASAAT